MIQATISVSGGGFERTAGGLVCAEIFLQVGELPFPDSRWTDFVVVVLTGWCEGFHRLLSAEREAIEVPFMDGPFLVKMGLIDHDRVHIELVEARVKRLISREAEVDARPLIHSVLVAAGKTLAECRTRGWWSDDADKLAAASSALRQELQEN